MAPNDALRSSAVLLNAIADLAVDVEGQLRDGGHADLQRQAQALQAHAAQFAKRLDAECTQTPQNGETAHE